MRHRYECPLRWADLDSLGHINNVLFVDYLQEARVDMFRAHGPSLRDEDTGLVVVRHEIDYQRPLGYRFTPVSIECWVVSISAASFAMDFEVFDETDQGRVTYVRARTVLAPVSLSTGGPRRLRAEEKEILTRFLEPAPATPTTPFPAGIGTDPRDDLAELPVRFSDIDIYGHVNNVQYFTYLQESRIGMLTRLTRQAGESEEAAMVVARTEIDYVRPMLLSPTPYQAWTRLERLGSKSLVVASEFQDEAGLTCARARVVMVFFSAATQRSSAPSEALRRVIAPHLVPTQPA